MLDTIDPINLYIVESSISIGGQQVKLKIIETNQADKYFDLDKFQTNWHKLEIGEYHFSQLLYCLRKYWFGFEYEGLYDHTLEARSVFYIGSLLHKEIQDYIEKISGFTIIERPVKDEFSIELNGKEETITIIGKIDLLDILEHSVEDIKTLSFVPKDFEKYLHYSPDKFEEKFGFYIIQVFVYAFYLNHSYFRIDPVEKLRLILVNKLNLSVKVIEVEYDDDVGFAFYQKVRERAKYLHKCLRDKSMPDPNTSSNCIYCQYIELCPEGMAIKQEQERPICFESNQYETENEGKKAFYKRNGEWRESKGYIAFKEELKQRLGEVKA